MRLQLISLIPLIALVAASSPLHPRRPVPRSYDTHTYYALELHMGLGIDEASAVANSLGAELVEQIGELKGHWLVRAFIQDLSARGEGDRVLKRWNELPRHSSHRSLVHLPLKKRAKRVPPNTYDRLSHTARSRRQLVGAPLGDDAAEDDDTELLFAQNELGFADPILNLQWHLINTRQTDFELNVTGLWAKGITGEGVKVAIIDDGLDLNSDDLAENFFAEGSYDFNDHTELPLPRLSDDQHGTRCAGEIAAVPNDVCGVGVSHRAKVAGVRILSAPISDADEAAALNYGYQLNDIYSCSWGPPDDGKSMEAPEGLILKAMVNGVQKGRGGKGSVFVFAAGNGGGVGDQCNFDGYTNSIFSVTVGAIDRKGLHPYYSEQCAAMMIVAPSSGSGDHISANGVCMARHETHTEHAVTVLIHQHTTDVGKNKCAHGHGGTSAAAPLAVGVFALALQVRPELTWRDIQHVAVQSAVHLNPDDPEWQVIASGRNYSYKYGFGMIDAGRFVELAEKIELVKPQTWFDSPAIYLPLTHKPEDAATVKRDVFLRQDQDDGEGEGDEGQDGQEEGAPPPSPEPSGSFITSEGVESKFVVTQEMLDNANFEKLEHVTVRVWITHQRRGDVELDLRSPAGVISVLARARRFDEDGDGFIGWKFMSLKHWEENPVGEWSLSVRDRSNPEKTGRFVAWSLQLWGEAVDPALARDWAPAEDGQPDEEETGSYPTATQTVQKPKPTEHLPDDHGHATGEADQPGLGQSAPTPLPTGTSEGEEGEGEQGDHDHLEDGWFSGVSNLASNPSWLAGAGGIVILAGIGVGGYFAVRQRQKRNKSRNLFGLGLANDGRGARGAYAPVQGDDVPMGLLARGRKTFGASGGGGGGGGGGSGQTRELYDAFGDGPSDESDDDGHDVDGVGGRKGLGYHDGFLDDEGDEGDEGGEGDQGVRGRGYKDDDDDEDDLPPREVGLGVGLEGEGEGERDSDILGGRSQSQSQTSSGSWQDAAEDVQR